MTPSSRLALQGGRVSGRRRKKKRKASKVKRVARKARRVARKAKKFVKGSAAAKRHMARLRAMRK